MQICSQNRYDHRITSHSGTRQHSIQFHQHPGTLLKHNTTPMRGSARPTAEDIHAAGPRTQTPPCTLAWSSCSHSGALSQLYSKVVDKFPAKHAGMNVLARPARLVVRNCVHEAGFCMRHEPKKTTLTLLGRQRTHGQ